MEIWSLSAVNVPTEEDMGNEAVPYSRSMELMYMEGLYRGHFKDYLRKKRGIATPENYKKIICHMSSLVVSLHVDCAEITSASMRPLPIRIDGIDYEGYHSVKIQVVENLTIPLMTFLPIY